MENGVTNGKKVGALVLNEDDTARALRKISYAEIKNLVAAGGPFEDMTSDQKEEYLDQYGWTFDELIKELLDELGDAMKKFP